MSQVHTPPIYKLIGSIRARAMFGGMLGSLRHLKILPKVIASDTDTNMTQTMKVKVIHSKDGPKVKRNAPCPCKGGKRAKYCCYRADERKS